ncbi:MAG TPA: hypothetical protein PLF61_01240, partial [Candidatus Goldiibacteriota bacterium]|nr:hypothetical protein [Candidatus Goldiibacteriota bacterium]
MDENKKVGKSHTYNLRDENMTFKYIEQNAFKLIYFITLILSFLIFKFYFDSFNIKINFLFYFFYFLLYASLYFSIDWKNLKIK